MSQKIPKIIHYCWFGGNELPELAIKCIESWKNFFPDYQIKRWDEKNFDLNVCSYVKEAYEAKKWAFVSDYARFWILYNEGGIYFDTDVEVIRSFERIIENGPFMGCEQAMTDFPIKVAPGLGLGAVPQMPIYKKILDYYNTLSFYDINGEINLKTIVEYTTDILQKYGLRNTLDVQNIEEIMIYPPDYFCPINYVTGEKKISCNTYSIHHYSESWKTKTQKHQNKVLHKLLKTFGERNGYLIWRIYTFPNRVFMKLQQKGLRRTIKFTLNKMKGKK